MFLSIHCIFTSSNQEWWADFKPWLTGLSTLPNPPSKYHNHTCVYLLLGQGWLTSSRKCDHNQGLRVEGICWGSALSLLFPLSDAFPLTSLTFWALDLSHLLLRFLFNSSGCICLPRFSTDHLLWHRGKGLFFLFLRLDFSSTICSDLGDSTETQSQVWILGCTLFCCLHPDLTHGDKTNIGDAIGDHGTEREVRVDYRDEGRFFRVGGI